ncbi:Erv1/Alr family protein [Coniochaeta ligniaria NRRL 30616]|uniref:Sulfhydryl oxidase n=1 Tax=Coniochaeta ligniaria NRRL 30616 TaxID=1408157 RepID=A0A1J7K262_9PEZI|nr:Erv1/Alr family protein [Coniochaeta ligniaria NRRL 30616]
MARRQHVTVMFALAVMALITLSYMISSSSSAPRIPSTDEFSGRSSGKGIIPTQNVEVPADVLSGGAIAPKLENATAKAELGRASWKLFHTMMARFPEKPTPDESLALKTYITLFARLYPCGDCARHFQQLLAKYPPQVGGRNAASGWACLVHNEVNKRLKKPEFDCTKLDYDCGCGEDEKKEKEEKEKAGEKSDDLKGRAPVSLEKEGLTRGG